MASTSLTERSSAVGDVKGDSNKNNSSSSSSSSISLEEEVQGEQQSHRQSHHQQTQQQLLTSIPPHQEGKQRHHNDEQQQTRKGMKGMKGRWTRGEHDKFLSGLDRFGKDWRKISALVQTRSIVQIRTHAQKYFKKREKGRSFPDHPYDDHDAPPGSPGGNISGSDSEYHSGGAAEATFLTTPAASKRGKKTLSELSKAVALAAPRAVRSTTVITTAAPVPSSAPLVATVNCKNSVGTGCTCGCRIERPASADVVESAPAFLREGALEMSKATSLGSMFASSQQQRYGKFGGEKLWVVDSDLNPAVAELTASAAVAGERMMAPNKTEELPQYPGMKFGPSLGKKSCGCTTVTKKIETMPGSADSHVSNSGMPRTLTDNIWAQFFSEMDACKPTASSSSPDIDSGAEGLQGLAAALNFSPASTSPLLDINDRQYPFVPSTVATSPPSLDYNAFSVSGDGCPALSPALTPTPGVGRQIPSTAPLVTLPATPSSGTEVYGGSGSGIGARGDLVSPVYPKPGWRWPIVSPSSADEAAIRHGRGCLGMRNLDPPHRIVGSRTGRTGLASLASKRGLSSGSQQVVPSSPLFGGEAGQLKRMRCGMIGQRQGPSHGHRLNNNKNICMKMGSIRGSDETGCVGGCGYPDGSPILFEDHLGML